ncbi:hypothetical protein [Desulfobacter curvatus]|uniref:hypothetical protein n=1 Tax=Desulfobacter curvatus TaxID=2290 RepID=UPI000371AB01|nr:hypothetical protein [Desulfobacter curvatus]
MSDIILSTISSVTISGLLTAGLIFLSKSIISERLKNAIKNEYDLKLENYKNKLKFDSDVTIEKLKADLQIAATDHNSRLSMINHIRNTKFSRIDSDRAEAIKNLYFNLFELEYSGLLLNEQLGDLNPLDKDIENKALKINNELTNKFNIASTRAMNNLSFYAIYFDNQLFTELYRTIDSFIIGTKKVMDTFQSHFQQKNYSILPSIKSEYQTILEDDYLIHKKYLTNKLREVLGSDIDQTAHTAIQPT